LDLVFTDALSLPSACGRASPSMGLLRESTGTLKDTCDLLTLGAV
jgi:hypothetical protein